jgi:hypothetical protein
MLANVCSMASRSGTRATLFVDINQQAPAIDAVQAYTVRRNWGTGTAAITRAIAMTPSASIPDVIMTRPPRPKRRSSSLSAHVRTVASRLSLITTRPLRMPR